MSYGAHLGYVCQFVSLSEPVPEFAPTVLGQLVDAARLTSGSLEPADEAIADGTRSLSWASYVDQVARLAGSLVAIGVKPGDRVAVRLARSVDSFVAVHAILRAGGVMVPLDPASPSELSAAVVQDAAAEVLITDARAAVIAAIAEAAPVRSVVVLGNIGPDVATSLPSVRILTGPEAFETPPGRMVHVDDSAPAYIIYTSGSTGRPKGIVHSHRSALAYAATAADVYGLHRRDRLANIAGLHFDQSTFELYAAPLAGSAVVVVPDPVLRFPASATALLESSRATVVYTVPSLLRQLSIRGALGERDLSRVRWVLFGGEAFPPGQLAELMGQLPAARFSNVYGPAEVNQCTFHHVPQPPDRDVPIGRAWPGAAIEVVDADDLAAAVPAGRPGILMVRSETLMSEYWNRPNLTAASIVERSDPRGVAERWFVTGDLVVERESGDLEFLGRVDNQVKVRGQRVELEAIDVALGDIEEVRTGIAVIGRTPTGDSAVVAVVVPASEQDERTSGDLGKSIMRQLAQRLPRVAVPVDVVVVSELPRTGTGKIDRTAAALLLDS